MDDDDFKEQFDDVIDATVSHDAPVSPLKIDTTSTTTSISSSTSTTTNTTTSTVLSDIKNG